MSESGTVGEPGADAVSWAAVRAGDPDAFVAVFEAYGTHVLHQLYRRTGSWADAEDLTGAVFLVAWQRRHEELAGGDAALLPRLLRVAANVAANGARSRRRYEKALARVSWEAVPDHADDSAGRVDAEREAARLTEVMAALPGHEREALHAVADAGLDHQAAAAVLQVPLGTLSSRVSRGRRRVRDRLRDLDPGHQREETP